MNVLHAARKTLLPVTGTVRLVRPVGAVANRVGEVEISGKGYYVRLSTTGYVLTSFDPKRDAAASYDLPHDLTACTCPDATFRAGRPGGCRHRKALAALKAAGRIS